jgi:hypothetical protein
MAVTIAVGSGWDARSKAMADRPRLTPGELTVAN